MDVIDEQPRSFYPPCNFWSGVNSIRKKPDQVGESSQEEGENLSVVMLHTMESQLEKNLILPIDNRGKARCTVQNTGSISLTVVGIWVRSFGQVGKDGLLMYSTIVADHANNPRCIGPLASATHLDTAGVPGDGHYFRVWLEIEGEIIRYSDK